MEKAITHFFGCLSKTKASALVFLLFLSLGAFITAELNATASEAESARTNQIASSYANSIEKVLQHALSSTNTLAVMVQEGKGNVPDFNQLVRYMLPMYKGAFALSLAPQGVIRQIEPAAPNILVKDHDLLEGEDRAKIIKNIREGELKFQGPFKLIQGPQGAIGMLPVFLKGSSGEKHFWGYTVVTLKFPDAFYDAALPSLERQGYAFRLSGVNPATHQDELIQSSIAPLDTTVIKIPVTVYGSQLELKVSKLSDGQNSGRLLFEVFLVVLAATLMAWLAYSMATVAQQRKKLHQLAMYDPLTHLPNRRLLGIKLDDILVTAQKNSCEVVVCYLDLDGFKAVNDSLGHAAGDQLLKIISERLQSCLRGEDIIARIGGDEFVVVLTDIKAKKDTSIIDRLIHVVSQPLTISGEQVNVSASIGAALYPTHGLEVDKLLLAADQAMYLAKKSGKNRFLFSES
ncbi:MAG: signal transduction protein [Pseudomonas sp.]|nr:signal transduction protein [Pseudomonas sp.]